MKKVDNGLSGFDFLILGGFGTLVAHEIAYVPSAFSRSPVSHGHLPLLWAIVSPLALLAVGFYIVRSLRSRPGRKSVSATQLGLAMALIFVAMEIVERLVNGLAVGSFVFEGVMWAGLATIPIVAAVLSRIVSTAVEVMIGWIGIPPKQAFTDVVDRPIDHFEPKLPLERVLGYSQSRRGPPIRIVY